MCQFVVRELSDTDEIISPISSEIKDYYWKRSVLRSYSQIKQRKRYLEVRLKSHNDVRNITKLRI